MPSATSVIKETETETVKTKTSQDSDNSFRLNPEALKKQQNMLKTMSTEGLRLKWVYLKNCSPFKTKARTLARKIEKELIRRKVLVEDDDESTLTEGSWCG